MPLHILIILVVCGIGGIAALLHLTGRSRTAVLNADNAREGWHRHFPEDQVGSVVMAANGQSALVQTDAGPGVIWVFGLDTVARHLRNCDVARTNTGLRVNFHDYAVPPTHFALESEERDAWQAQMEAAA